MGKFWALLFGVTMLACFGLFVAAPFVDGWWLQEGRSTHYWHIDFLYYVILAITGFFFVLTEAILVYFMFRYAGQPDGKPPQPKPSVFAGMLKPLADVLNEPHKVELAWTIIPAAILLYIAFAQVGTWAAVKYQSQFPKFVKDSGKNVPVVAEISARQFEWRIRYPSYKRNAGDSAAGAAGFLSGKVLEGKEKIDFDSFGKIAQFDDVHTVNELHAIKDHPSLVHLSTKDVIHSFNMPHLRIKQDALPGKVIPVWFIPTLSNTKFNEKTKRWEDDPMKITEIACAELCGWGHGGMIGRLYVHEDVKDFLKWLKHADDEQNLGRIKQKVE